MKQNPRLASLKPGQRFRVGTTYASVIGLGSMGGVMIRNGDSSLGLASEWSGKVRVVPEAWPMKAVGA